MIAGPRRRGMGRIGGGGRCGSGCCCGGVGIGISMGGKSIQSASSSSIFDDGVFVFDGRESAERDRSVSLLRVAGGEFD